MIPVLDTSAWQSNTAFDSKAMTLAPGWKPPDFTVAAAKGVQGNIARCSIGDRVDPYYQACTKAAVDAGIVGGAYHWLEGLPAVVELGAINRGFDLAQPRFFMLDVEDNDMAAAVWRDRKLLDYVFAILAMVPHPRKIVYTGGWWWNQRVSAAVAAEYAAEFARYDLVAAFYTHQPSPPADVADTLRWCEQNRPVVPGPSQWFDWLQTTQTAPSGRTDAGGAPAPVTGWDTWDGWQGGSWAYARDYGFASNARLDYNVVKPDAWARWATVATPVPEPVPPPVTAPSRALSGDMWFLSRWHDGSWWQINARKTVRYGPIDRATAEQMVATGAPRVTLNDAELSSIQVPPVP
jgi:hypothetical protein